MKIPANTDSPAADLDETLSAAEATARTASRHGKSLEGSGFYAAKFSELHAAAVLSVKAIDRSLRTFNDTKLQSVFADVEANVANFFDPRTATKARSESKQKVLFALRTVVLPAMAKGPQHAPTDGFFPLEIVLGTRPYIEAVARQACGSFDLGWYDAAAVMSRRLLETLIIETFETHKLDAKIKKPDGTFFYLNGLVTALLNETAFNISRNVRRVLPKLKDLGDQSAHGRRYVAKKQDLDEVKRDLRITLEELVHLSELSKS